MSRADDLIGRLQEEIERLDRESQNLSTQLGACGRELAALKAQQPSGVVLPERASSENIKEILRAIGLYGRVSCFDSCPVYNSALDAVARLNPCRAQSVPALMALREAITPEVIDWLKCGLSTNGRLINGTHPALEKLKAAILAAPSAQQKESGDE